MLDENQMMAARHMDGPCMVLAGPGSGKTTVITERVKYLAENGIDPARILVVTFTRAAAAEMRTRFLRLTGSSRTNIMFGTFHAVFYGILKEAFRRERVECAEEGDGIREVLRCIGKKKNGSEEEVPDLSICTPEQFKAIERAYEETKEKRRKLDFDDILWKTKELFIERPDILKKWQERFRYLLVDEFQDINPMQYEVMRLLAEPERNLFVVGDDDQSIYRFRGADPQIMLNFPKDYPETNTVCLGKNYRCQKLVTELSKNLIRRNQIRYEKEICAVRREGAEPVFLTFPDYRAEQDAMLKEIRRLHTEEGIPFSEMAVLFRTNQQPEILMERLMKENIPFRTKELFPNRYRHWITRDLFAYLEAAEGNRDRGLIFRLINRPKRYLKRDYFASDPVDFERVKRAMKDQPESLGRFLSLERELSTLRGMKPFAAVNFIRRGIGYDDFIREYARTKGLEESEMLEKLEDLLELSRSMESFSDWKEEARRYTEELESLQKERKDADAVTLATLHGAKGLEFRAVFLIDCVDTVYPYKKAASAEDLEEERRMFYVGVTRAKDRIFFYDVKKMHRHPASPSPFLAEMKKL